VAIWASVGLLQSGAYSVTDSIAFIRDIAQLKAADSRIRGILGENFLEHFDLLIDYRQHVLCLDNSKILARAVKGEHVALAEPYGSANDLPFTQPIIVFAHLSASPVSRVTLRR
jgi:hypothetical protein